MGGIIRGDVVDATDVMVPEQGNAPAPQVQEQDKKQQEQVTDQPKEDKKGG